MDEGKLRIEYLPLNALTPYERNARAHGKEDVDEIVKSIKKYGFADPIAVWGDKNIIVEGHGRLIASRKAGLKEVPVIRLDYMTDEERREYALLHNKTAELSAWDWDALAMELSELDLSDFDIDWQLPNLDLSEEHDVEDDDFDEEPPENPFSQPGDIFLLGEHRLMCGDSTNAEDVKALMDGEKADIVFTDPPWNVNYGATEEGNPQGYKPRTIMNDSMSTEAFKDFMDSAFARMSEASKDGCMTYVVMSAQEWGNLMLTLAENGYHWSSTIIWNKDQLVLSRKDYHTKYEPIWYGWKDGAPRLCPLKDRKQCDVWDFERPKRSDEHPTMKPVALVARALQNSSREDDVALDLFGGSGTTLIAAEQTGRRCRMMELDPKYCDVIVRRYLRLNGNNSATVIRNGEKIQVFHGEENSKIE